MNSARLPSSKLNYFFPVTNWTIVDYFKKFGYRREAGQLLARKLMLSLVADFQQNKPLVLNPSFVHGLRSILGDSSLDKEFVAKTITLPGEGEIMDLMEVCKAETLKSN